MEGGYDSQAYRQWLASQIKIEVSIIVLVLGIVLFVVLAVIPALFQFADAWWWKIAASLGTVGLLGRWILHGWELPRDI